MSKKMHSYGVMYNTNKLENIINLDYEINFGIVAEGIESKGQLKFINKMNCHNIQEYIFRRLASAEEFTNYLKSIINGQLELR